VISGEVAPDNLKALQSVTSKIPNITSLVRPKAFISKRMVRLRVHVLEVDSNYAQKLGIEWNKSATGPNFSMVAPIVTNKVYGILPDEDVNWPGLLSGGNENITRMDLRFATSIFSRLHFLESNGHAKTLSRPEILARSGETADLQIGGEIPIIHTTANGPQVTYKPYGVILKVKPTVNSKNEILLNINAEVSSVDNSSDRTAFKNVKASTTVTAYSGATVSIAGLLKTSNGANVDKVPGLGNIPILGKLFKKKGKNLGRREVVILVTPELITPRTQNNLRPALRQDIQKLEPQQVPLDRDVKGSGFYTDILE
jgi:pilus assembly protein CpaC